MRKTSPPLDVLWTPAPETLDEPLRARKPRKILVADIFDQPFEFIAACYGVAAACPRHTLCFLTKRPERMREFMAAKFGLAGVEEAVADEAAWKGRIIWDARGQNAHLYSSGMNTAELARRRAWPGWPLLNVIHGYSAANQADLDAGIADLLATPSALRCLSLEPLIGPVDVGAYLWRTCSECSGRMHVGPDGSACNCAKYSRRPGYERRNELHWVITGGESGPGARPCDIGWIRSIVSQCKAAGVPCFVKQLGSRPTTDHRTRPAGEESWWTHTLNDRKGADPTEWPADLRVRQWPEVQG